MSAAEALARSRSRRRSLGAVALLAVVGIFAALIWYGYDRAPEVPNEPVPLILADPSPVREAPDDPGGMDVPFQDALIYGEAGSGPEDGAVEELLPPPEDPIEPPQLLPEADAPGMAAEAPADTASLTDAPPAEPITSADDAPPQAPETGPSAGERDALDDAIGAILPPDEPTAPTESAPALGPVPTETVSEQESAAPAAPRPAQRPAAIASETPVAPAPPPAIPAAQTAAPGDIWVQLGSLREPAAAEAEWRRLSTRYAEALGSIGYRIVAVELGERGTFHRLQGGPVSAESAQQICQTLNADRAGSCLVVRP